MVAIIIVLDLPVRELQASISNILGIYQQQKRGRSI